MDRLNKAGGVIEERPIRNEWDAFGKWLWLARIIMGGSTPNHEDVEKPARGWSEALGVPECMSIIKERNV